MTGIADRVKLAVPASLRTAWRRLRTVPAVRSAGFDARDAVEWLLNRRHPLTPPRKLLHGIGWSPEVGHTFLGYFRELADLRPDDRVLDVGWGIGRMAVPLAGFLRLPGRYDGFDIVRANVAWCRRAITPRYPHFRFRHADLRNTEYNPRGRLRADTFRFPYPDGAFDFAFLTSVFTHLPPTAAAHYLAEVGRVLRPGGRCLATFFLLNPDSERLVDAGRAVWRLHPADGPYRVANPAVPEECLALDEAFVRAAAATASLGWPSRVQYGNWCGRADGLDFQDIAVLRKAG